MDKLGRQCAHISAQSGCLLSLKFLHDQANADVYNSTDHSRMTALHIAAKVIVYCQSDNELFVLVYIGPVSC